MKIVPNLSVLSHSEESRCLSIARTIILHKASYIAHAIIDAVRVMMPHAKDAQVVALCRAGAASARSDSITR